jgi:hypothetical protein
MNKLNLWLRWVAANGVGEMLGLGGTFAVLAALINLTSGLPGVSQVLLSFVLAVLTGSIEATIISLLQWSIIRHIFPTLKFRAWWCATVVGALAAYVAGYLPSTIMNLGEQTSQMPVSEPPQWIQLLLAGGLGLVTGAILSFAQWLVLRKHVAHAGVWLPANMVAWAVGMPIIFWGMDLAMRGRPLMHTVGIIAGMLLLTGMVVGAVHGLFLLALAQQKTAAQ